MIVLRHRSKINPDFTINHIVFNQIVKLTKLEVIQHFERSEMRASVLEFVPSDLDIFLVFYEHIKFKKINSYDDYRTMIEFCGMYGLVMGLENHIDELLFLHSEGQAQAIQSLLIIRMFLSHSSEISFGEFDNIYIQIMKFLVKQSVLSNQNTFFGYSDFEFGVLNELNIFDELKNDRDSGTTMIILQTLDLLALLCPLLSEKSRIYLPLILYDVLSLVADHCLMIRMYAARTLQNISLSLQYDNVKELINSNLDYLVDSAYTSLTCHYYHCNAVTILRVLIEFFPSDTLLSVLVLDSMRFMLKISHEFREASLCFAINTFKSYTTAVIKFYRVEESNKPDITYPELDLNQSVWEYFTKLDEDTSYDPLESNEAEIKKLPQFELVKDIVEVISHYITSHSNILSISVIQTCQLGLSALSNFESDRLPLIHKVWVPIMFHVQNSNVRILPSVMSIVGSLANHSKDFIRDRLSKELLPQILSKVSDHDNVKKRLLLISNKSICYHDDSILAILRLLKDVVARVEMRESDLLRIYEISQRIGCTSSPEAKLVVTFITLGCIKVNKYFAKLS
ncbi:TELO2-interacting protein 1 [Thelohanellus kitauei]|uniref:TELO2-interacting protein 1 n=1 Tax=Thelohanellus kitauei TaxID=669202 RepID=A0A0C2MFH7_THEKT|nr:TELO2-interacting protein 1 [Thelohanellus kitauei]